MNSYGEAFIRLIYPASCGLCGKILELHEECLCSVCAAGISLLRFSWSEAVLDRPGPHLDEGWALFPYEASVRKVLTAVKFKRRARILGFFRPMIRELAAAIRSETSYDMLVPVPLGRRRLLKRGFNQSEMIARYFKEGYAAPVRADLLGKTPGKAPQSELGREERLENITGAFKMRPFNRVAGRKILLIDDILTTGATANEAARILKKQGARRVGVFALTRTAALSPVKQETLAL